MSDLLAAASMLMTVFAFFYGLFYRDIELAINTIPEYEIPTDNGLLIEMVKNTIRTKARPLAVASSLSSAVFIPDAVGAVCTSARHYSINGIEQIFSYDAVSTSFCLVVAISVWVSALSWLNIHKLGRKKRELEGR
jgi:hypothetical protein